MTSRVGANYKYLCDSGAVVVPPAGEQCMGPFGDTVLEGHLRDDGGVTAEAIFAVWSVNKASPCCGWSVLSAEAGEALTKDPGFKWLKGEDVPVLGDVGFVNIDFDAYHSTGADIFGNSKTAMKCELD